MKLRQKLAVVLATAMVVTAVPVVTMAASDNAMLREVLQIKKGDSFERPTTAGGLAIKFKDAWQGQKEVFYLELTNAEWNQEAMIANVTTNAAVTADINTKVLSGVNEMSFPEKKVMRIVLNEGSVNQNDILKLPLLVKATGGEATVELNNKRSITTATPGKWTFATTGEKKATYAVGDVPTFYTNGKLAPVTLTETYRGSIYGAPGANEAIKVTYELQDADFYFDFPESSTREVTIDGDKYLEYNLSASTIKYATYSYGFSNHTAQVTAFVKKDDKGVAKFEIYGVDTPDSLGTIKLQNLPVRTNEKNPEVGDLLVDIKSDNLVDAKDNVKLATIAKYSTYIKMKDDKAVNIEAGRTKEIEFKVGEYVDDSITGDREIEITLDKGHFAYAKGTNVYSKISDQTKYKLSPSATTEINLIKSAKISDDKQNTIIVTLNEKAQINGVIDNFTFKLNVCVPVDKKDGKEITIKAAGRALEEKEEGVSTVAVNIVNPFNVTMEELRVKTGLQAQVGGKVVVTETDKAMFNKGTLTFSVVDPADGKVVNGIQFYNKDNVTYAVSGDIKKADLENVSTTGAAVIKINRQSKEASTLTLSDFKVTVDRTVPEGKYDLVLSGTAIDSDSHTLTVKDFFVIGTPNTEDLAANGLRRGTASFVIGEAKYSANGKSYDMTAASYIQDPGYTMIPVRYVAEAFGISGKDVIFSGGAATFFAGERTIQLKNGSDIAIVNGVNIKMATKVVIKEGRTYAPVAEVAKILGISSAWDSAAKTATFTNN